MKKVCFIISGSGYSGAEIVLNRFLDNNLAIEKKFIIIFDNKEVENKLINLYGTENIISLGINYNKSVFKFLIPSYISQVSRKLNKIINKLNPDVIYVNNTFEGVLSSKFIKNCNKKTILHIHDMRQSYTHPYNNYIIKKYFKYYNKIITVSNATKRSWVNLEMDVVYNGLKEEAFCLNNSRSKVNKIGLIGSLNERKGADVLLNCIDKILLKTDLDIFIVFKDYSPLLKKKLEKFKNYKRVNILENIDENQMTEVYDNIDLLIVPSRLDPLPTVIMEAQARGIIVLGNNSSGIPEMIPIKSLIRNIADEEILISSLIEVSKLDEEVYKKYSKIVYDYTYTNFLEENKKEKINNIIKNI